MDRETLRGLVDESLEQYFDKIVEMCNAPYAVENGIELVRVEKDLTTTLRKDIKPGDLNSNGFAHGAVTYGLMDHAFAVCCNVKEPTVGLSCNVTYFRPCTYGSIDAVAKVINESKSLMTVDVSIHSNGKLIVSATCIGFKARMK